MKQNEDYENMYVDFMLKTYLKVHFMNVLQ